MYKNKYIKYKTKYLKLKNQLGGNHLDIPNGTINIPNKAYIENELNSVTIPTSVTSIGNSAFEENKLSSLIIPNSVTKIGSYAFAYNELTSVTLPNSITEISFASFSHNRLLSLIIPNSVTNIGVNAFSDNELISISIPYSVTIIDHSAFEKNKLKQINLPSSIITIGKSAFKNNELTSLTIPNKVRIIDNEAFKNNRLSSIIIPNSVNYIGNSAFAINKLISVILSTSITTIYQSTFANNELQTIIFPPSITTIHDLAFANNKLISIDIPLSITHIGKFAFGHNKLTSITIPNSINTISDGSFESNNLSSVIIPDSVTTIGDYAFEYNSLQSITIPLSVTTIGIGAFKNNQLRSITIPLSVTVIGNNAFINNQLTSVTISDKFNDPNKIRRIFGDDNQNITFNFIESPTSISDVLENIPQSTENAGTIIINYQILNKDKNFYISDTQNVFETLYLDKTSFLNKKPYFRYLNVTSMPPIFDAGVDVGGLTSNVFSLLSEFFTKTGSKYFIKYNDFYTLNNNEYDELETDKIKFMGKLFGSAIQLRQLIEINLHPLLLYQILNDDFDTISNEKILAIINEFDPTLLETHPYTCLKTPITDIRCDYDVMGEIIINKNEEAIKIIKSFVHNKNIVSFIDGFRSQINITTTKLKKLPLKLFNQLICGSDIELNYVNLMKYLKLINFNTEQLIAIKELIQLKISSDSDWVKTFLFALTNKNKIPISGYEDSKQLRIELKEGFDEPYIIYTCFNSMYISNNSLNEYIRSINKSETELFLEFNTNALKASAKIFNIS